MAAEWLPALAKAASSEALLKEVYGDLAKPGVSQVGKALGGIIGLGNTILWPLHLLNERARLALEASLERYREKLATIEQEKIAPPPAEVGVPVAEKLAYVEDVDLRELYLNLLAKASNVDTQSLAHPSFVNVINNMAPDEALLIKFFGNRGAVPFVTGKFTSPTTGYWLQVADLHMPDISGLGLSFERNVVAYVSNLQGMGLLAVRRDIYMVPVDVYEPLESQVKAMFANFPTPPEYPNFVCERGKVEVTPYGRLFFSACVA